MIITKPAGVWACSRSESVLCWRVSVLRVVLFWPMIKLLFRRLAVEVLVVCLRLGAGMVDDTVPMIRGRIERIEL